MKQTFLLAVMFAVACGPEVATAAAAVTTTGGGDTCPRCTDDNTAVRSTCDGKVHACAPDQACSTRRVHERLRGGRGESRVDRLRLLRGRHGRGAGPAEDACFAVFVANTSRGQAHINVDWNGQGDRPREVREAARRGRAPALTYGAVRPVDGPRARARSRSCSSRMRRRRGR